MISLIFFRNIHCIQCDLSSLESVRECAKQVKEKEKRIDGLLNNAGVLLDPKEFTKDGIETHWSVNHLGHYLLTRLLEDELENGGRVVFMVNLDYRKAKNGINYDFISSGKEIDRDYAFYQSQCANVMMMQALAKELRSKFIAVNGVYPGVIQTSFYRNANASFDKWKTQLYFDTLHESTVTQVHLLSDYNATGVTGKMFFQMKHMSIHDNALKSDEELKKLMLVDDYWCGLKTKEEINKEIK